LLRVPPRALAGDLDRGVAVIERATGAPVDRYRPPYGVFSPAGLAFARRRGWEPTLWSRWGHDWRARSSPARIAATAVTGLAPRPGKHPGADDRGTAAVARQVDPRHERQREADEREQTEQGRPVADPVVVREHGGQHARQHRRRDGRDGRDRARGSPGAPRLR